MLDSALLLTAHGHAPYLLGTRLVRDLVTNICIPGYYENQQDILRAEFPNDAGRIFLSETLGALLKPLLIGTNDSADQNNPPTIDQYASGVRQHLGGIHSTLEKMLHDGVEAISLDGTRKKFSRFDFALNTGLPVHSPVKPVFFAFVSKMSEIYRLSPHQSAGVSFLTKTWKEIEASFSHMFVPRLHSLHHNQQFDSSGIKFTPPFAKPYPVNTEESIPQGSTLVVVSGTGRDVEKLSRLAKASSGPCVTLAESPEFIDLPRVSSAAWGNPNVVAVLARSGLGSIWQAVLNQKPIGIVRPDPKIDPEVFHNAQMVENVKVGTILDRKVEPLINVLSRYRDAIREQLDQETSRFHTTDGIEYTSAKLKRLLLSETAGQK